MNKEKVSSKKRDDNEGYSMKNKTIEIDLSAIPEYAVAQLSDAVLDLFFHIVHQPDGRSMAPL